MEGDSMWRKYSLQGGVVRVKEPVLGHDKLGVPICKMYILSFVVFLNVEVFHILPCCGVCWSIRILND